MHDGHHVPQRAIDGSEGTYWGSNPGDEKVEYIVMFPRFYALSEIIIDWKWPPLVNI